MYTKEKELKKTQEKKEYTGIPFTVEIFKQIQSHFIVEPVKNK